MNEFSPDNYHEYLLKNRRPSLAFDENADFDTWRMQVKEKLTELLGDMPEERVPLNVRIEWEKEHDDFIEKRFIYDTEPFTSVPCHLLIPKNAKKPCPVVICLQGHSTGMHVSLGRKKFERDEHEVGKWDGFKKYDKNVVINMYINYECSSRTTNTLIGISDNDFYFLIK